MDFGKIEKKWQKIWKAKKFYKTKDKISGKKNFYHLVMFPYPSGNLHIGHWYNFAPSDIFARFKKMSGFNILSPIGFDAFGLPAENAAIKRNIHPKDWTYKNIKTMSKQLESMGNMYDWSREIITADPQYYKWTQWMFLQLYKKGLVYKKKAPANWCPKCHTVLANEQVISGQCERCDSQVIQREIEQWLFKITDYADKLLKDLDDLDWPEKTKTMQRNWIGKSEGTEIEFKINDSEFKINIFTTRLDTIFGCTYLVMAPEHSLLKNNKLGINNYEEVKNYLDQAKNKSDLQRTELQKNKTGVELKGIKAINPFNNEEIPVYVADYVLGYYGTGAVMAVPAHDQRDFEFAKKYKLPIKQVICQNYPSPICPILEKAFTENGHLVDSKNFTGLTPQKAREEMANWLEKNKVGKKNINYKIRDWLVSRQRYWGAPIPIIYCDKCGIIPVPEKNLPVKLPNVKNYLPTEEGKSPLAHSKKFINTKCPQCGAQAKRETDTMDTFVCSSWYYLRYADPNNSKKFADPKKIKAWLPVNMYIGGAEHSVLHLLYARFLTKVLYDLKFINFKEPFASLKHQGIILGPDGQKMSKSRGNVIDPDELVRQFGSDCVRMYLAFMGQYDQGGPWNPTGILGIKRFLERIWNSKNIIKNQKSWVKNADIEKLFHQTIKKVSEDIENFQFNTAISALMVLLNEVEKHKNSLSISHYSLFLKLLAPFAPHLSEELWQKLENKKSIHLESWPKYNPELIKEKEFELIIQINGKIKDKMFVNSGISQQKAQEIALNSEKIKSAISPDQKIKKIIFVPDKLINIVI
ncbi:leucine--tRNA ligase [Candidatus Wolfebacteria bacterium]|nr:leucine--tRNA ligase [Candidatus Wolfebacteria bacterium]